MDGRGRRSAGDVTFNVLPHLHHLMPVLGTADCAGQEFGEEKIGGRARAPSVCLPTLLEFIQPCSEWMSVLCRSLQSGRRAH